MSWRQRRMRSPIFKFFYCSMIGSRSTNMICMSSYFASDHIEEGFDTDNVVYFQLSLSAPASSSSFSQFWFAFLKKPLGLLHYRLISDVLSSGTMVSALSVDMEFISRRLHRSRSRIPRLPNSCTISIPYIAMLAVFGHCLKVCRTIRRVLVLLAT